MTLPPLNIPQLLKTYHLRPKKKLGQNFLIDPNALERIIDAAQIDPQDTVLEIGAGLGSLTRLLSLRANHVTAIEIDQALIPILEDVLNPYHNVDLIQGNILDLDPIAIIHQSEYIVVANIPYYITSALLRHLLEASLKPKRLVLTIQQEVAERICVKSGKMSLLALSVHIYGKPQIKAKIPAGCFYPVPAVDSNVLSIELFSEPRISSSDLELFFNLAHAGFNQKRKTLRNALTSRFSYSADETAALIRQANIDPQRRAETLSLEEWHYLTKVYQENLA